MNSRVPPTKRYQPTEYEHAANCATHGVGVVLSVALSVYFVWGSLWSTDLLKQQTELYKTAAGTNCYSKGMGIVVSVKDTVTVTEACAFTLKKKGPPQHYV